MAGNFQPAAGQSTLGVCGEQSPHGWVAFRRVHDEFYDRCLVCRPQLAVEVWHGRFYAMIWWRARATMLDGRPHGFLRPQQTHTTLAVGYFEAPVHRGGDQVAFRFFHIWRRAAIMQSLDREIRVPYNALVAAWQGAAGAPNDCIPVALVPPPWRNSLNYGVGWDLFHQDVMGLVTFIETVVGRRGIFLREARPLHISWNN